MANRVAVHVGNREGDNLLLQCLLASGTRAAPLTTTRVGAILFAVCLDSPAA